MSGWALGTVVAALLGVIPAVVLAYKTVFDEDVSTTGMEEHTDAREVWKFFTVFWSIYLLLVAGVVYLGTTFDTTSLAAVGLGTVGIEHVGVGTAAGIGLYAFSHVFATICTLAGISSEGGVAHEIGPETTVGLVGWAAGTTLQSSGEEVMYRACLIGALSAVLGVSPWMLVVPAALLFGAAHLTEGDSAGLTSVAVGIGFGAVFVTSGIVAAATAHAVVNVSELVSVTIFDRDHLHAPS